MIHVDAFDISWWYVLVLIALGAIADALGSVVLTILALPRIFLVLLVAACLKLYDRLCGKFEQ